jgi:hypothetical protein
MNSTGNQRNWLERLGDKIPGYSGYVDKERRRDIDKLHRTHLADRLRSIKTPLTDIVRELSSTGRLFEVGPIDRIIKKLDKIENRVRFASYGYAGFFDVVKVEERELNNIYQFDLSLVEKVDTIEAKSRGLKAQSSTADSLKTNASDLESLIDDFDQTFDKRHEAINGFKHDPIINPPSFM